MRQRDLIIALIVMEATFLHALFGFFYREIPAWTMFKSMNRFDYELLDRNGQVVRIQDYLLPRAYWINSPYFVHDVGRWIAQTHPHRAPLSGRLTLWQHGQSTSTPFQIALDPNGQPILERTTTQAPMTNDQ